MKVKISDIAKKAGVSTGTVDRVLHKRGHVSPEKLELVEKALKELNYEPNLLASFLAYKKSYVFAAIVPYFSDGSYWELACKGIVKAANELDKFKTKVELHHFNQYDINSFQNAANAVLEGDYDGVIMATLFENPVVQLSQKLDERDIPYIYLDSDIPMQNNLAYFGSDTYVSGRIAGRILLTTSSNMQTIFFAHIKFKYADISVQMRNRERGIMDYLNDNGYQGVIEHIEIDPDNHQEGLQKLTQLLENSNYPVGGIVLNSRFYELAKVIHLLPKHLKDKLYLIGHDAISENIKALKNNDVSLLLSQRTDLQGYEAVKALGNYFIFKEQPEKLNYMPIDIVISENVDYYYNTNK
ncbi:substrate-binding domain-containing protein [Paludibacter sp.]